MYNKNTPGFIALVSVLVVGAIAVMVAVTFLTLGIGSSQSSFSLEQSNQAKALANACAEEALQQIRSSTPYTGTANMALGQGTCTYTVTSLGGQDRSISASGSVGQVIRKVQININKINPKIIISSWQEIS